MFNKKIICSLIAVAGFSLPLLASASLTVVNDTSKDSTSRINGNCSQDVLQEGGVTRHNTTKVYQTNDIRAACWTNMENCTALVFVQEHCNGEVLANISYDAKNQKIKGKVTPLLPGYKVDNSEDKITITEISPEGK